jgi:transposase-like protein
VIRDLVTNPCEDACGTLTTSRTVDGAPVYRCPDCDSEWYDERDAPPRRRISPAPRPRNPLTNSSAGKEKALP